MAAPHPIVVDVHLAEHVIDLLGSVVEIGKSPPKFFQRDDAVLGAELISEKAGLVTIGRDDLTFL